LRGKKGVSVIVGTLLLMIIAVSAAAIIYSMYAPQLVPAVDTNKILEDIAISKLDVNLTDVTLFILNKGGVNVVIDRIYIEDLSQNWILSQNYTIPIRVINVQDVQPFDVNITGKYDQIFNETRIIKVVTLRGTVVELLYVPTTEVITPPPTGNNSSSDNETFTITVFKFDDTNINGIKDGGESLITGWTFYIKDALTGQPIPSQPPLQTDASGSCVFQKLNKGFYLIEEQPQTRIGSFQWFNSTLSSYPVEINSENETIWIGNYLVEWRYTISGYVFNDTTPPPPNGDGFFNSSDNGLGGWTVTYLRLTGIQQFGQMKTDSSGFYQFTGLANGIYIVTAWQKNPLEIWIPTNPNPNITRIVDSPQQVNFSFYQVASNATQYYFVSGLVFNDTPVGGNLPDGIFNTTQGDSGLANVTLLVYNGSVPYVNAKSNDFGYFNIQLLPGIYTLEVQPNWDDWDPTTASSIVIDVTTSNQSSNFGLYYNPFGTQVLYITGVVFNDTNGDGIWNSTTEAGIPNISVYRNDTPSAISVSTDANGVFLFDNQQKGNYTVFLDNNTMRLQLPGYIITTYYSVDVSLTNAPVGGIYFGVYEVGVVSGWVYYNNDSIPGFNPATDYPIRDVTILLNGTTSTRTDANGFYIFDGLTPGYYEVQEIPLDQWNCTSPRVVVGDNFNAPMVVNFTNEPLSTMKFNITGTVFLDDDRDGINDIAYPGGDSPFRTATTVRVKYANGTTLMTNTTSTTTGIYYLNNLPAGEDYIVYINNIGGYAFTTPQNVTIQNLFSNQVVDFGIYSTSTNATYTISGLKYNDTAPYGDWNPGDTLMTNWGIYLYNGTNTLPPPFAMNYTYNGNYFFDNLPPGIYTLVELVEPGWANQTASVVSFNLTNHVVVNFFNNYTAFSNVTNLYTISGRVFNDIDNSGNYTVGDGVISNQLVILYDGNGYPIDFTSSNASGLYRFPNLIGGNYSLRVQVPSGYTNTTPYYQSVTNLNSNLTIDFGFRGLSTPITYTVDGYVFWDKDADGIWEINNQNSTINETALSGWTVYLYGGAPIPYFGTYFPGPTPTATTTTNANGYYYFTGLGNTTYSVVSRLTTGYTNTTPRLVTFTISGAPYVNASFGNDNITVSATRYISGFKFNDTDNSGSFTTGETKLNNWTIWLNDAAGFPIRSVTSNTLYQGERYFNFTGLPNGVYYVFEQLAGQTLWTNSTPGVMSVTISGSSNSSITFGNRLLTAPTTYLISGYVFNDTNRNNIFDDGNATMTTAWTVFLYSGAYSPFTFPTAIATTSSGQYTFSGLGSGTYTVVEVLQANYTNLWARSVSVTISGASMTNQSFFNKWIGPQPVFLVQGYKFNDTDLDQIWNTTIPDEAALSGWQISIYDAFGFPLASTTTSAAGYYSFLVPNGGYTLAENLASKTGWTYSTPYQTNITVNNATVRYDFGNYLIGKAPAYSIYGWVFNDTNQNRIQDTGEAGLSGWTVSLKNGTTGTNLASTTTNGSGFYIFASMRPAYYRVVSTAGSTSYTNTSASTAYLTTTTADMVQNFSWYYNYTPVVPHIISGRVYNQVNTAGNGLAGWTVIVNNGTYFTSKLTDSTGNYSFTLTDGNYTVQAIISSGYYNITPAIVNVSLSGANQILDFGMNSSAALPKYSVSGIKFNDLDKDGVQDAGDLPITDWGFILYNSTNLFNTFTNDSGIFVFNGLYAGTYSVNETYRGGWAASTPTSVNITVSSNGTYLIFGNYLNYSAGLNFSVSGYVFNDINRNSSYDGPDVPLAGWLVTLSDFQGIIIDSQLTGAAGNYNFSNLAGGNFTVTSWYDTGAGWVNTTMSVVKKQITNSSITNLNFGYMYDRYNVSGYVFFDADKNGIYQNITVDEYPLAGWQVLLRNEFGDTQVATTDANGHYVFATQLPGMYTISDVIQSGWNATTLASTSINVTTDLTQNFGNKRWFFGQFLTYDRTMWSADMNLYLQNNITDVYGSSWVVSIGSSSVNQNQWDNLSFIKGYLVNSQPAAVLDNDYNNPSGALAGQGGIFGANILALKLNVDYDNADFGPFNFGPSETLLQNLHIFNYSSAVNGKTIGQVLIDANNLLGTGVGSMTVAQYNALIARINSAFSGTDYTDATYFLY